MTRSQTVRAGQGGGRISAFACSLCLAVVIAGCASPGTTLVDCPLSVDQQQQAILDVVPRGSTRAEADRRLKEAGIEFSPGQKNSIYYLSLWNRKDGKRWHINVALLFDAQGKVYRARAGDSAFEPLADGPAGRSQHPGGRSSEIGGSESSNTSNDSDDELKHVPFPAQYEAEKRAR